MIFKMLLLAILCNKDSVTVPRVDSTIKVDGYLNEPVWQQATRLTGFHQYQPVDNRPASEETEVLVWYSPQAIHFGIIAKTKDTSVIRATVGRRDKVTGDDNILIFLDTFNDNRRAFYFGVNPLGIQFDGMETSTSSDISPDFIYESKGCITATGYEVEISIPFKNIRYSTANVQQWGLQIIREHAATGYRDTWTDVRRANASFLAQSGTIQLHDLEKGMVTEVQPFITSMNTGQRNLTDGSYAHTPMNSSTGMNLKVAFTRVAVDATINPDFSQVEADATQITVNERFALFLQEKRPFFLEGMDMFNTPGNLVYSRRIVNPITGAKVTAKVGQYSFAHLSAIDETSGDNAFASATRMSYDLGQNSSIGLTTTNRIQGDVNNHVLAADTRIVFDKLYFISAQLGGSRTHDGVTFSAPIWNLVYDRTGYAWGFQYSISGQGDDFRADLGFVPRSGITVGHSLNRFSIYGKPGSLVERINIINTVDRTWSYDEFLKKHPVEGVEDLNFAFQLRGGWSVSAYTGREFFDLDPLNYAGYQVYMSPADTVAYVPPDKLDDLFYGSLNVNTPIYEKIQGNFNTSYRNIVIFAEGGKGRQFSIYGGLTYQPLQGTKLNGSVGFYNIARSRDGSLFARGLLPNFRVDQQIGRAFALRLIGEYYDERVTDFSDHSTGAPLLIGGNTISGRKTRRLRLDWLAYYEPSPGTVAYLGYGSSHEQFPGYGSALRRATDGLFVKLAYRFRLV